MRGVVKLAPRSPGSFTGICPRRAGALDVILLVLDAQAAQRDTRQEAAGAIGQGQAGAGSLDEAVRPLQVFWLGIDQAGNLMPPFRASSIRRSRSDAFSASVAVVRFTPAASYMR